MTLAQRGIANDNIMTAKMNRCLSLCGAILLFGIAPVALAYNPADLKKLIATNKCIGCDLSGADLSRQQLVNADLQAATLVGANLSGANLASAKLGGANLTGANLTRTNLTGAVLQAASLIDVNFANTNLTRTDLSYANLVNTNFRSAILNHTDLAGANLALADFTGVTLNGTSVERANLVGAKGINPASPTQNNDVTAPTQENAPGRIRQRKLPAPIVPNVDESAPIIRNRPRVYRIPPGLGSPQRLVPGGTRNTEPTNLGTE
ncbi:pentapeptide repeat-containing protein [Chamaesiphon minutus]|uniref:Putative low-complexity protein n=1 Tax=Chamaesiphon minutus (strain ATCC 27169 / PCC 6605) TaxID=1173020 RepID=K9UJ70_CHAP6|nr:pentapeptide repeat-containing protein [Chamaesiphon minutus]AFY94496.1 putative low-complexity protein [Chamaesiphon minutus PCC 6605]